MPIAVDLIDGGTLSIEGIDDSDIALAPRSHGVWQFDGRGKMIVGLPVDAAFDVPDTGTMFTDSFSYQGGTLSLGTDIMLDRRQLPEADRRWAVWEGLKYAFVLELVGVLDEAAALTDRVWRFLEQFAVLETSNGVTLLARERAEAIPFASHQLRHTYLEVHTIGRVKVSPLTEAARSLLPSWGGYRVLGGELFHDEEPGQLPAHRLILVNDTTVASITPIKSRVADANSASETQRDAELAEEAVLAALELVSFQLGEGISLAASGKLRR